MYNGFSLYYLQLGQTTVQFIDRRVMFGQVPLHLTTTRTAMLRNNSQNHAFFQVPNFHYNHFIIGDQCSNVKEYTKNMLLFYFVSLT